ncbi:NAD(P)H-dependent oxidoreductase [Aeromicrobium chenweiae]|uniref:NAD(P)H dehydrogenase n=1 Tax=Aeromicrobium chenweiae TaxID=2079793 RepID=A0A2S0WMH3_9ACTN|nr:NAD(P)H-dependent oxidoreductase [Aeromicrobium chenweiae]AWB92470.1 NAD(P)H dehydrogenase [Aeromicrobium chenweiae]TGN31238.1 flavodoxin family protein [Aeromicrobium chenweiae]
MAHGRSGSTLIVTAHPDETSLTHGVADRLQQLLGPERAARLDLAQEGFDPRFTQGDRDAYVGRGAPGPDVVDQQRRVDEVDHLVLVFPVFWWSLPALLKGWIDRVFIADWAFAYDEDDAVVPRLGRLTTHLLAVSGTSERSFDRHGYAQAFETQIHRGVIDFCGMQRGVTRFVRDAEAGDGQRIVREVEGAVAAVAAAITTTPDEA